MINALRRLLWLTLLVSSLCTASTQAPAALGNPVVVVGLPVQTTPPLGYWVGDSPAGFSIDYLRYLADQLNLKLEFRQFATFEQATTALCEGRIDIVPDLQTNAERQRCMDFSSPYLLSPLVLVVRHGSAAITPADLSSHSFVAEQGYTTAQWLSQRLPPSQLRIYADTKAALDALQHGEGDAYLGEPYQLEALFSSGHYKSLEVRQQDIYDNAGLHFGISSLRPDVRDALAAAMARTPSDFLNDLQLRWLDKHSINQRMQPSSHLTTAQRQWVDDLPMLRVSYETTFRPMSFLDEHGRPNGLSYSYLKYLVNALRLKVVEIPAPSGTAAPSDEIDLRIPVDASTEHLPGWRYTQPFVKIPNVLVTRLGEPAKTAIEELNGATLVVPDNPKFAQRLQQRVPDSLLLRVTDPADGFELVRTGKADGYVGNLITVDRLLEKGWSDSLKIAAATDLPLELSIAVTERHAQLAALLDQLIQSIPIEQRDLFAQQWLRNTYEIGVSPQRLWRIVGSIGSAALLIIGVLLYAHLSLKTRQRALRETQQRLSAQLRFSRELLESYPYPVAIKDRQRRYLMLNKAYERTFNVEAAQVLGRSVDEISYYPAQVRQRISKMVDRALRDDERQQGEHILVGEDGSDQHWLYIVTPYRLDGAEPQGVLTTFIDVTSIRAAEQLAEQAAEAKAAFLATMSHEIRTPMNGILGLLELMSDLHLPTDAQEMLTMVNESTRSLLQVLDDTLDFSRIDSGMLVVSPEPTDLRQLLDGVLRLIGHQAHGKGLALHSLIDHRIAGLLEVDGSRLRQVLLNLLSNATKFTQSGHVRLELSVKHDDGEQHLEFLVADTGIGISQAQQERLFQPFMQADSSITRRYGGSGLGLMISRRLVQLMGGELYLHSCLNEGTRITFTLSLPVVAALEKPFASHSVKLASDLAPCQEALAQHLLALGFQFTSEQPDLLITTDEASAGNPGTLLITTEDLPAGYAVGPSSTRLSVNPLTWGGLQAALEQLLLGRNSSRRIPLPRSSYPKGHKVLIVEDHPTNRLLLKRQMEHLQCAFDLVENGLQALERLQTQQYTLILTDCYMPELDGYAMTRQVRDSQLEAATIPIIGMTASIHPQEQQRARAAGMDELILKPIVLSALITLFERYLCAPPEDSAVTSMGDLKAVMWDSFCAESRKDLLAIEAALISDDAETLGHLLHKLAGALQLVDLTELSRQAQHLHREALHHSVVHAAVRDFVYQLRAAGV